MNRGHGFIGTAAIGRPAPVGFFVFCPAGGDIVPRHAALRHPIQTIEAAGFGPQAASETARAGSTRRLRYPENDCGGEHKRRSGGSAEGAFDP